MHSLQSFIDHSVVCNVFIFYKVIFIICVAMMLTKMHSSYCSQKSDYTQSIINLEESIRLILIRNLTTSRILLTYTTYSYYFSQKSGDIQSILAGGSIVDSDLLYLSILGHGNCGTVHL